MKIGQKVIFTKRNYRWNSLFKYGKTYIIIDVRVFNLDQKSKTLIKVINDKNDMYWIGASYFNNKYELRKMKLLNLL